MEGFPLKVGGQKYIVQVPEEYVGVGFRISTQGGAFARGAVARVRNEPTCPYKPGRGSGSFMLAWKKGFQSGTCELVEK